MLKGETISDVQKKFLHSKSPHWSWQNLSKRGVEHQDPQRLG